jgi:catechol 2,3-dioxygenase-like lactoylglutathione lyase family enzyme
MSAPGHAHVSLNVADLARAVAFYRDFLGVEPAFERRDYARFELAEPPLVLSLEPVFHRASDAFNHLGIKLATRDDVHRAQERLRAVGMFAECDDVECCYAQQTKFWVMDPDRNLWEVYAKTGDLDRRASLTSSEALAARDRAGAVGTAWEHRLGDDFPERIPHDDGSVDDVRLRGTFNTPRAPEEVAAILRESRRVLRPGGQILVHGLVSDRALRDGFPRLPGPAALVRSVPLETEVPAWLGAAGFVNVYLQKLGEGANFRHDGAAMRELMVCAWKAATEATASAEASVTVVYRGPFREVTDDAGRTYTRAERVSLSTHDAQRLQRGPLADQFVFLKP